MIRPTPVDPIVFELHIEKKVELKFILRNQEGVPNSHPNSCHESRHDKVHSSILFNLFNFTYVFDHILFALVLLVYILFGF